MINAFATVALSATLVANQSCSKSEGTPLYNNGKTVKIEYNWEATADSLQTITYQTFLSADGTYKQDNVGNNNFNYWWNAHMLDVLADGYSRTKDDVYKTRMKALLTALKQKNGGAYPNDFYDDMEWLALAALRSHQLTQDDQYLDAVNILWADIKTGINTNQGGGVSWRKGQFDYKNTPANAPAIILAARLYKLQNKAEDLETAKTLYVWLKSHLVDPATGLVWDGINRQGNSQVDKDWIFTYNQGIFIGAALELFKVTKNAAYLTDAVQTANTAVSSNNISPQGILKSEGQGDGGLFKGILVRYLTQLIQEPGLSSSDRERYVKFLQFNGQTLYSKGISRPALLVSPDWNKQPGSSTDLSSQLSGVMMMEAAALLKKDGKL
ncbi:MAG: hypothetical protein JWQ25_431 [Daejeonella sp.]|nr:hypothetical protein [Daejeonella sp.]